MSLADSLKHCPKCGSGRMERKAPANFCCPECEFIFYVNPCAAVVVFLEDDEGRVLFIRRAKEPAKGKLAFPGGFIDVGERAETALAREVREEVGLELKSLDFLCSFPNQYLFRDVLYDTVDFFFVGRAIGPNGAQALDEVESVIFLDPLKVDPDEVAFVSLRNGLAVYLESRKSFSFPRIEGGTAKFPAGFTQVPRPRPLHDR